MAATDQLTSDLTLAGELVHEAGVLAARMLREGLSTQRKTSVSDVVSAADHAAEELVARRLREQRPADGIVGEEGTADEGAGRTWYVDPVDGTYNFLSGLPVWCSALARDDVLGAVYQPSADELWLGAPGRGLTCNGEPVAPLADRPLAEISLASYVHPPRLGDDTLRLPWLRAAGGAATLRMLGSGSVELAAVAAGRLGAYLQAGTPPWDWLPGATLVRAAGGAAETVEAHGHRWTVAGPARAVDELIGLLQDG